MRSLGFAAGPVDPRGLHGVRATDRERLVSSPSVAFLVFHVAQVRNFIHDDLLPAASALLRRESMRSDILESTLKPLGGTLDDDLETIDTLAAHIRGEYQTVVYSRLWSEDVFRALRDRLPGIVWVYLGDSRVAFEGTDYCITADRIAALPEIARAAAEGRRVDLNELSLLPIDFSRARPDADLVRLRIGSERSPDRPSIVHGSPGCAFSADIRENPQFANVAFPDDGSVVLRGCSFCATGGVPRRAASELLASVLEQLDHILENEPGISRIQINDQNPFPYLLQFVNRASERTKRPLEILIETRADWFLANVAVFERALDAADKAGHRILLFLVGIENFSPRVLERLNKGVDAEMNIRTVEECRRLRQAFPRSYSDTRAAFGFILYDPWTELDDLAINAEVCDRIRFREFRGQLGRAKLRLYPDTALFYKAKTEGLLADRFPFESMDSARRYGYEAEVPWRFVRRETHAVYGIHDQVARLLGEHEEMKMLLAIVRFIERNPGALDYPVEEVARDVVKGMASWIDREVRHSTPV